MPYFRPNPVHPSASVNAKGNVEVSSVDCYPATAREVQYRFSTKGTVAGSTFQESAERTNNVATI